MLIQAIGAFTLETEGQKQPLVIGDGEFAELANGVAKDAVAQGAARKVTMAEYLATLAPAAPAEVEQQQQFSATDGEAESKAPRRGKRSNPATEG